MPSRSRRTWVAAMVTSALLAACQVEPSTRRGPVELGGEIFGATLAGEDSISVEVPTCNGDPELGRLTETDEDVVIQVISTQVVRGGSDACLDSLLVTLDAPLGDRALVDETSGRVLRVVGRD